MRELNKADLDNWITGHYGEDQFSKYDPDESEKEEPVAPLKENTMYIDGRGNRRFIVGPTKVNPEWYWSLQGSWYERSTGNYVSYRRTMVDGKESGEHYVTPKSAASLEREDTDE